MKPKIKMFYGMWLCGGIFTKPWYVDWYSGKTPEDAYNAWKAGTND